MMRALVNYLPVAPAHVFEAMGGIDTFNWANSVVDQIGLDDIPEVADNGEITVLGLPYGGPNGGKDNEGQYFSPLTDFLDGVIDTPPVYYTHGTQNGFEPDPIGKVSSRWYDRRGGWFKVKLDPQSPRYAQLLEAHDTGNLRASSGAVPASYDADPQTGHINTWLVGELSLVDLRDGYRPVNPYAITKASDCAKCEQDALFTTYYGDVVKMDWMAQVKALLGQLFELIQREEAAEMEVPDMTFNYKAEHYDDTDSPIKAGGEFGGKKRSELKDSDFLFPETRSFPVKDCEDVRSAVRSWGRYKGSETFETFKSKLIARAKKLNCESSLPDNWKEDMSKAEDTEKCANCDAAAELANAIKAEIASDVDNSTKCAKCPEAVDWVKTMYKAGKIKATEAFAYLDTFVKSDETYAAIKAEVEGRAVSLQAPVKAELFVAGGTSSDPNSQIDQDHMNKQRKLVGLPVKK